MATDPSTRSVLLANSRNRDADYQEGYERVFGKKRKRKPQKKKELNGNDAAEKSV